MFTPLRQYGVLPAARQPLIDFMVGALERAGCRVILASDAKHAPFVVTFETPLGERIGIVAYAFLATRTPTRNRPDDERSFQIKYGKKEANNLHDLWIDRLGLFTTLLIGIDPAEGFFVAADPAMHNPTKFFIRLEFKDAHVEAIKRSGWYAWERVRRAASGINEPIEVLVGGTKDRFLDLVRFERAAQGLEPGDRQLLAERHAPSQILGPTNAVVEAPLTPDLVHPLVKELALDPGEILEVIAGARRLKMAVRGWVAEEHLRAALLRVDGVTRCEKLDVDGGPDLQVSYQNGPILMVECKNVLRDTTAQGLPRIDFQRTRASRQDPCSRYYAPTDFDVVAGCLHAVTERWEFKYRLTEELARHSKCLGKLASNVQVDDGWTSDPRDVFLAAYERSR